MKPDNAYYYKILCRIVRLSFRLVQFLIGFVAAQQSDLVLKENILLEKVVDRFFSLRKIVHWALQEETHPALNAF